jgi:hypothetical protein
MHVAPKDGWYLWGYANEEEKSEWYEVGKIDSEWNAYITATIWSAEHAVATLRDLSGTIVYAAFVYGNRVWHTLESGAQ